MREIVSVNLGQCGIQLSGQFWQRLSNKITSNTTNDTSIELINRFYSESNNLGGCGILDNFTARAILVDTEIGAVNDVIKDEKGTRIDSSNIITGTEATGNNWAIAYETYGPKYKEPLEDMIRGQVEGCDSLQCFNLNFSLSGGTGSGLGSYLLELLTNDYSKTTRIANVITQRNDATVATYNTILCLNKLQEFANLIITYSNESILDVRYPNSNNFAASMPAETNKYFGPINEAIHDFMLPVLTTVGNSKYISSHVDTLVSNLTPFPGLNYCCPGISSLGFQEVISDLTIDQIFWQAIQNNTILSPVPNAKSHSIGTALFGATKFANCDISRQATRIAFKNDMLSYNRNGIKLYLKSAINNTDKSDKLCVLDNNCAMHSYLKNVVNSFQKLYSKKAFLHHFQHVIDDTQFQQVSNNISEVSQTYQNLENNLFTSAKHLDRGILESLGNTICSTNDSTANNSIKSTKTSCTTLKMQVKASKGLNVWDIRPNHLASLMSCNNSKPWWDLCASPLV